MLKSFGHVESLPFKETLQEEETELAGTCSGKTDTQGWKQRGVRVCVHVCTCVHVHRCRENKRGIRGLRESRENIKTKHSDLLLDSLSSPPTPAYSLNFPKTELLPCSTLLRALPESPCPSQERTAESLPHISSFGSYSNTRTNSTEYLGKLRLRMAQGLALQVMTPS